MRRCATGSASPTSVPTQTLAPCSRLGQEAEAAGWEALLIWDHLGFVWGQPAADPWVTLAAVAARTSSLLLGTNVTPVSRRRPHVLAHQVATLDMLSGGRVISAPASAGSSRSSPPSARNADARTRADRLDEGLEVLRRLWSGERVDHHGRHYTVDGVTLAPRPAQEQAADLIGGNSARALRRAARFDGWAADTTNQEGMTKTPGDVERALAAVREARDDLDGFDVAVMGHADQVDPGGYAEVGATWWLENVHDVRGSAEEMFALVRQGPPG